jgi:hypothetical protein
MSIMTIVVTTLNKSGVGKETIYYEVLSTC